MLKILTIRYLKPNQTLMTQAPESMYIDKDFIEQFIAYHKRIAVEIFGNEAGAYVDHQERPDKEVTARQVFTLVAERTGHDVNSFFAKTRKREIVEAKQMAIKICNEYLDMSPSKVERETNITHDNQWYSRNTISALIETYQIYEDKFQDTKNFVLDRIFNNNSKSYEGQGKQLKTAS